MKSILLIFVSLILSLGCKSINYTYRNSISNNKNDSLLINNKLWHYLDYNKDSIPGTSIFLACQELTFKNRKNHKVIVAVLDSEMDIYHKDLKDFIWTNPNEIPNNGKDDDHNGYKDDVHGWNYWGNSDGVTSTYYTHFEYVRIFNKYDIFFKNKNINQIPIDSIDLYQIYNQSKNKLEDEYDYQKNIYPIYLKQLEESYIKQKDTIQKLYPEMDFNIPNLKSIQTENDFVKNKIKNLIYYLESDIEESLIDYKKTNENHFKYYLNPDYRDRNLIDDDTDNIFDINYGNNILFHDSISPKHATEVSSIICNLAHYFNNYEIKIMPIITIVNGDPHDKDIALAIRYAVDNGASIINMSFGKQMSLHNEWVMEAIKYAEENNVIIVKSAGNEGIDITNVDDYPNDVNSEFVEVFKNFITVGSSNKKISNGYISSYSNYSNSQVDLFAPGEDIYVSIPNNQYRFDKGTSLSAPIVTGIAALLKSYYPDLKAHEIKEILMESGTVIDLEVEIKDEQGNPKKVPFSSLSKSGKIVNAYQALVLAQRYQKNKKN
jgi:cell wall-associated protease